MNSALTTELDLTALSSFNYIFTVIRGVQAGREYYVAMCPLYLIPKLFPSNDESYLNSELRAQRMLNRARIPQLVKYIIDNPTQYVLPSITISVDGEVEFKPLLTMPDCKIGILIIPMSAKFIVNDGQHRIAAIKEALKLSPKLGRETISVIFFVYAGLKHSQQIFTDLNKYAIRPSNSLNILYDHRDRIARLTVEIATAVPIFKDRIDFEKTTLSTNSKKLFTLSNLYQSVKALLGNRRSTDLTDKEKKICIEYWMEVTSHIREWRLLLEGKITVADLRRNFIHAHGVTLQAFGIIGYELLTRYPSEWRSKLSMLEKIDFTRTNKLWEGRAVVNGRICKAYTNIILTTNLLKHYLGLELSPLERSIEETKLYNKLAV